MSLFAQEAELRRAMVPLQGLPLQPPAWRNVCAAAAAGDTAAVRHALAWRQHRVPDIEGAAGDPRLSDYMHGKFPSFSGCRCFNTGRRRCCCRAAQRPHCMPDTKAV